jgi:hypothetical protein
MVQFVKLFIQSIHRFMSALRDSGEVLSDTLPDEEELGIRIVNQFRL